MSCCESCRDDKKPSARPQDAEVPRYEGPWCGTKDCPCEPASREEKDGHVVRCVLSEPIVLHGFPVAGSIEFNGKGSLLAFVLHEAHVVDGVRCRAGSAVQRFQSGKLKECSPDGTQRVDGIACSRTVALHLDGKLRRCELAEPRAFGGAQLPERAWITLFPSGKLERFEAYGDAIEVQGLRCRGSFNYLFENGKLKKCTLAAEAKLGDKTYPTGATVCFDETGKTIDCDAARGKPASSSR
jgi:hypothetical protein